jgi:release factor glutamine methyltransferase
VPSLQREVLRDPLSALDGGPDGLLFVRRLLQQAPAKLASGARIALELAKDQPTRLAAELAAEVFTEIKTVKDYGGCERFLFAMFRK